MRTLPCCPGCGAPDGLFGKVTRRLGLHRCRPRPSRHESEYLAARTRKMRAEATLAEMELAARCKVVIAAAGEPSIPDDVSRMIRNWTLEGPDHRELYTLAFTDGDLRVHGFLLPAQAVAQIGHAAIAILDDYRGSA